MGRREGIKTTVPLGDSDRLSARKQNTVMDTRRWSDVMCPHSSAMGGDQQVTGAASEKSYTEVPTLIRAPADGRTSGPTLVTREVMKRAAPTLVLRPTPRLTYSAHARDSL